MSDGKKRTDYSIHSSDGAIPPPATQDKAKTGLNFQPVQENLQVIYAEFKSSSRLSDGVARLA